MAPGAAGLSRAQRTLNRFDTCLTVGALNAFSPVANACELYSVHLTVCHYVASWRHECVPSATALPGSSLRRRLEAPPERCRVGALRLARVWRSRRRQ